MSSTVRPPLTTTRLSRMILEGTAALVAFVLLAWLPTWFQPHRSLAVRAFWAPPDRGHVPYLRADAEGLSGAPAEALDAESIKGRAGEEVANAAARSPMVVAISAPRLDANSALDLIREVASKARRDVLIVLDLAQVDSDRELGVFGNAPYRGLEEKLAGLPKPGANVAVLCSCEPGQKSWMIDGIGRSAFSYFVQQALTGRANAPDRRSVDVEELARFVRSKTARWVAENRRQAVQTPILLKVGPASDSASFALSTASPKPSKPPTPVADAKVAADSKAAPKAEVPERDRLMKRLMEEWNRHRSLVDDPKRGGPPWRDAPARWRVYQSALLRAERMVRAACHDPSAIQGAEEALNKAGEFRDGLERRGDPNRDFPLLTITPEDRDRALDFLTRRAAVEPAQAEPKAIPAPNPLIDRFKKAAKAEAGAALELQFPAWAWRFQEGFKDRRFEEASRGRLLRRVVSARSKAEAALARDRRGLDWIRSEIVAGDSKRRVVQDDLFGDVDDSFGDRIDEFEKRYDLAGRWIDEFHSARSIDERVAARLPTLGESAILDSIKGPEGTSTGGDDFPPAGLTTAIDAARALGAQLAPKSGRGDPKNLTQVADKARTALEELETQHDRRINNLLEPDRRADWRDLDDALADPWIHPTVRAKLLRLVVDRDSGTPQVGDSAPASSPVDVGFHRKARGLAWLEAALRGISTREPWKEEVDRTLADLPTPGFDRLAVALDDFAKVTRRLGDESDSFVKRARDKGRPRAFETEEAASLAVFAADRAIRFRHAADLADSTLDDDRAARALEDLARQGAIRFHAERLALDFAPDLHWLDEEAIKAFNGFTPPGVAGPMRPLLVDVSKNPTVIDKISWEAKFQVGAHVEDGQGRPDGLIKGRAFIGAQPEDAGQGPGLKVSTRSGAIGGLVPLGGEPDPIEFIVRQDTTADSDGRKRPLAVKVFFRGRFGDDSPRVVEVECREFDIPVLIAIEQDRTPLYPKYQDRARTIKDQFANPGSIGYMHQGGSLAYILSFKNQTPNDLKIEVERTFDPIDKALPQIRPLLLDLPARAGPKKIATETMTSKEVPLGEGRTVVVVVKDFHTHVVLARRTFLFKQLAVEQYLTFNPDVGPIDDKVGSFFRISVRRKKDDPVTEPILGSEIETRFDDETQPRMKDLPDDPGLVPGGFPFVAFRSLSKIQDKCKWSIKIHDFEMPGVFEKKAP